MSANLRNIGTGLLGLALLPLILTIGSEAATTVRIASGLSRPLYLSQPPGDYERLFIVEQDGRIRIVKDGAVLATAFLDISAISSCCGERGLLGLAFHPNYQSNGFFYVNYTNNSGNTVIARYQVSGNPDSANPASALTLKTYVQPESNHNGGCLQFGPDGMLYVASGDGGGSNDNHPPIGNGQNSQTMLGKILRLDVDVASPHIPADNPFVGATDTIPEIWAFGMRNPWRISFDRLTGDLWMGDVGQDAFEEIDFEPAESGGRNYGWRCMEGTGCTSLSGCVCNTPILTLPVHQYPHSVPCHSITGGYVYRGCALPELEGTYFFAEYCDGHIYSFKYDGVNKTDSIEWTITLDPPGSQAIGQVPSFGQDNMGELYICDFASGMAGAGEVYKMVPDSYVDCDSNFTDDSCQIALGISPDLDASGVPDACEFICVCACGTDPMCDGVTTVLDVVESINVAFRGVASTTDPDCVAERTDVDCDGVTSITDVTHVIDVAFRGANGATEFCIPCNCSPYPTNCP